MAKQPAKDSTPSGDGDPLIGDAIPRTPQPPPEKPEKPDLTEAWYRPAKQYIRREQWNKCVLKLLEKLPPVPDGEERILRYIGLPGQHNFDLLSMRGICTSKKLRVNYLGFRVGPGAPKEPTPLDQLVALSSTKFHTPDSYVIPDSVENIGLQNTPANKTCNDRGPFDVINLDVCGGILHGNPAPLLNAIKAILLLQNPRPHPWLLFVTTLAKHEPIDSTVLNTFFKTLKDNCDHIGAFEKQLNEASNKCGLKIDDCLNKPKEITAEGFVRYFTLAFGKWLLVNLNNNSPRAVVTLQSALCFRNTGWDKPEMLSLAYLATPIAAGGKDPTRLTGRGAAAAPAGADYEEHALGLIKPSLTEMKDLDEIWCAEGRMKTAIVADCEALLAQIGADGNDIKAWKKHHKV